MPEHESTEEQRLLAARARVERMIERYLARSPYAFNPDPVTVEHVTAGLTRNLVLHGRWHCPCRQVTADPEQNRQNICPCPQHHDDIARDGVCECGLFVSRGFADAHPAGISRANKEA